MPSPSKKGRGGIYTNVDPHDSVEKQLQDAEDAHDLGVWQDYKRNYKDKTWHELLVPGRDGRLVLPESQINVTPEDIRRKHAEGKAWRPLGYDVHGKPVFSEEAKEAMRLGYSCPNCWQLQKSALTPECDVKNQPPDTGCGYRRSLTGW